MWACSVHSPTVHPQLPSVGPHGHASWEHVPIKVCVQTSVLSDHFVPHYSLSSSYFAVSLPHSRHAAHRDTLRKSSTVCRMKFSIDLLWPASASSIQQQVVASGQKRNLLLFLFITVRYNLWWRKNTAVYSRKSHGCITNNLPPTSN